MSLDPFGGLGRALRKGPHFRGDDREAPSGFADAAASTPAFSAQKIGLKGDFVDHADGLRDLFRRLFDAGHRFNGLATTRRRSRRRPWPPKRRRARGRRSRRSASSMSIASRDVAASSTLAACCPVRRDRSPAEDRNLDGSDCMVCVAPDRHQGGLQFVDRRVEIDTQRLRLGSEGNGQTRREFAFGRSAQSVSAPRRQLIGLRRLGLFIRAADRRSRPRREVRPLVPPDAFHAGLSEEDRARHAADFVASSACPTSASDRLPPCGA